MYIGLLFYNTALALTALLHCMISICTRALSLQSSIVSSPVRAANTAPRDLMSLGFKTIQLLSTLDERWSWVYTQQQSNWYTYLPS
ncbi:hypothetical protein F5X96DRAFT_620072 [Biscogniauxia mediterranea]|nr:hypothetical protein F5X96DRAFT_620072 [Biscogniauxia mediterranea]